jgi:hypothetical protein
MNIKMKKLNQMKNRIIILGVTLILAIVLSACAKSSAPKRMRRCLHRVCIHRPTERKHGNLEHLRGYPTSQSC